MEKKLSKKEKLENTIAQKVGIIKELKEIMNHVKASNTNTIKMKIETKKIFFDYVDCIHDTVKQKHKIEFEKETIISILESAIEKEQEYINKCIDLEIELINGGKR